MCDSCGDKLAIHPITQPSPEINPNDVHITSATAACGGRGGGETNGYRRNRQTNSYLRPPDRPLHPYADSSIVGVAATTITEYLDQIGMPQGIVMRHRPAHFAHLFASSGYAAGYFVYQWAQVLDNDVFAAFEESGNVFDTETAERCRKFIYSAGNTVAPQELFRSFRGRDPDISHFLKNRGLL